MTGAPSRRGPGPRRARSVPRGRSRAHDAPPSSPGAADEPQQTARSRSSEEEHERQRRRVAQPVLREAGLVDVLDRRPGGVLRARPALLQQVDLVEHLQRGDHLQHGHEHGGRGEQRQRDVPHLLPRRRAVGGRRLVELARDLLQAGEVEHEVEADRPPDGRDDHGDHRHARLAEPVHLASPSEVR